MCLARYRMQVQGMAVCSRFLQVFREVLLRCGWQHSQLLSMSLQDDGNQIAEQDGGVDAERALSWNPRLTSVLLTLIGRIEKMTTHTRR